MLAGKASGSPYFFLPYPLDLCDGLVLLKTINSDQAGEFDELKPNLD